MSDRMIIAISGADREEFLQGLVTNDIARAEGGDGIVYAALLSPQGKYIADFFVVTRADDLLVDVAAEIGPALVQRLSMYRLRADVTLSETDLKVRRGTGPMPDGALPDTRHEALGWRLYGTEGDDDGTDFDALRVAHAIPETGAELGPDSYILEMGFERLHGVDFRKGCYVGQEVTARMKHKTELRKGLARVAVEGPAEPGTEILAGDKPVGRLMTRSGNAALAYLRFDRIADTMRAGEAQVRAL